MDRQDGERGLRGHILLALPQQPHDQAVVAVDLLTNTSQSTFVPLYVFFEVTSRLSEHGSQHSNASHCIGGGCRIRPQGNHHQL